MTFWTVEQSVASGAPIELHEFRAAGTSTYWRYADAPEDVVFNGNTFAAIYIKGGAIEAGSNALRNQVEVVIDPDCSLPVACVAAAPEQPIQYARYKLQGAEYVRNYTGEVIAVRFTQSDRTSAPEARLVIDAGHNKLRIGTLLPRYGRLCGVPLYSHACGVDPASFSYTGVLDTVSGTTVTSDDLPVELDGQFAGGRFTALSFSRKILTHTSYTLALSAPISGLASSLSFSVRLGCDHTPIWCDEVFDDLLNYRGQPFIPTKNPFGGDPIC